MVSHEFQLGENVKVVQELVRHANSRSTLNIYSQARIQAKRDAQQRVVEMILPEQGSMQFRLSSRRSPEENPRLNTESVRNS